MHGLNNAWPTWGWVAALALVGCADKAEADYAECVALEAKGELEEASEACEDAIEADPNSKSGKAAADKLEALEDAVRKAKAEANRPSEETLTKCKAGDDAACNEACDKDHMPSCLELGVRVLKSDDRKAKLRCKPLLRKACDADVGRACTALTDRCLPLVDIISGKDVSKAERAKLALRACDLDDGEGCDVAASKVREGSGVPRDATKAEELQAKAFRLLAKECDSGDPRSCWSLAMKYDPIVVKRVVPVDVDKAMALYKKACDGGENIGCVRSELLANPPTHEVYGTSHDDEAPYLALRSGPGTQHDLVGKMPDGTRVRLLRKEGYWRFVRVSDGPAAGKEGYAHGGHVRPIRR